MTSNIQINLFQQVKPSSQSNTTKAESQDSSSLLEKPLDFNMKETSEEVSPFSGILEGLASKVDTKQLNIAEVSVEGLANTRIEQETNSINAVLGGNNHPVTSNNASSSFQVLSDDASESNALILNQNIELVKNGVGESSAKSDSFFPFLKESQQNVDLIISNQKAEYRLSESFNQDLSKLSNTTLENELVSINSKAIDSKAIDSKAIDSKTIGTKSLEQQIAALSSANEDGKLRSTTKNEYMNVMLQNKGFELKPSSESFNKELLNKGFKFDEDNLSSKSTEKNLLAEAFATNLNPDSKLKLSNSSLGGEIKQQKLNTMLNASQTNSERNIHLDGSMTSLAKSEAAAVDSMNRQKQTLDSVFTQGLNMKQNFAPNLAMRIQWMFNQALSSAEIMMDPPDMGPLTVKIQQHNGETNIMFQVAQNGTKELVEDNLAKLKDMLNQQGIDLGEASVEQQQQSSQEKSEGVSSVQLENLDDSEQLSGDTKVLESDQLIDIYS